MLPVGSGQGELWHDDHFLCTADYEISAPRPIQGATPIQRVRVTVKDEACSIALGRAGMTLVLADGTRHRLPRPLHFPREGYFECFLGGEAEVDTSADTSFG